MPLEKKKEHKCSHHTAASSGPVSWWKKFHFSGKVIMCSVLFGLCLALVGGLLFAIGMDRHDDVNENLSEVSNKAPMSVVGPVIMGIGGFTVLVGIIMCLFETNICRKRQPDARPLIDEQNSEGTSRNSDPASTPSTSGGQNKNRYKKKSSSSKNQKMIKKTEKSSHNHSPSSLPIDMQRSISRDLTSSDKFLTPCSSLASEHPKLQSNYSDAENQTSASLLKSLTSSGKSWNTSTEFQTPSSSFHDSSGSFEERNEILMVNPNDEKPTGDKLKSLKHEFLTPQNSSADVLGDKTSYLQEKALVNSRQTNKNLNSNESAQSYPDEDVVSSHDFVTPMNSYVDYPNSNTKWEKSNEGISQIADD